MGGSEDMAEGQERNSTYNRNGTFPLLFGVAMLVFGLMAPMYIMIQGLGGSISEHKALPAHVNAASQLAALQVNLIEIETQFKGVDDKISNVVKQMDLDNGREEQDIASNAALWERVKALERIVYGEIVDDVRFNGAR